MIGPANMRTQSKWWNRARLWRFIFLQSPEGWWEPSADLSIALLALKIRPAAIVTHKKGFFSRYIPDDWDVLGDAAGGDKEEMATPADTCPLSGFDTDAVQWTMPPRLREAAGAKIVDETTALRIWVCPLSPSSPPPPATTTTTPRSPPFLPPVAGRALRPRCCSAEAGISPSTALRKSVARSGAGLPESNSSAPTFILSPAQATALSVASLLCLDESWLASEDGAEGAEEETIVDRATSWLLQQELANPQLRRAIQDALLEAQQLADVTWNTAHVRFATCRAAMQSERDQTDFSCAWHLLLHASAPAVAAACPAVGVGVFSH